MCSLFFCYGDEENVRCACTYVHLTTANQSEIHKSYLVSVMATRKMYVVCVSRHCYEREFPGGKMYGSD